MSATSLVLMLFLTVYITSYLDNHRHGDNDIDGWNLFKDMQGPIDVTNMVFLFMMMGLGYEICQSVVDFIVSLSN